MDIIEFLKEHGLRPSTWPMFADPAIWRFFGEGLRETLLISVVAVALSIIFAFAYPWIISHITNEHRDYLSGYGLKDCPEKIGNCTAIPHCEDGAIARHPILQPGEICQDDPRPTVV